MQSNCCRRSHRVPSSSAAATAATAAARAAAAARGGSLRRGVVHGRSLECSGDGRRRAAASRGSRISWLRSANGGGMAETAACERVASVEFPAECGGCDPAGQPATWTLHASTNCYAGFGAEDLETPGGSPCCTFASIDDCFAQCVATAGCEAVVVTSTSPLLPTRVCGAFLLRGRLCRLRHVHHAKGG